MTVDDIAKVCSDFYREDEVFAAKAIDSNHWRPDKGCLDLNTSLLLYYAVDLSRMPLGTQTTATFQQFQMNEQVYSPIRQRYRQRGTNKYQNVVFTAVKIFRLKLGTTICNEFSFAMAGNVSGIRKGLQARLIEKFPESYVPCSNHVSICACRDWWGVSLWSVIR